MVKEYNSRSIHPLPEGNSLLDRKNKITDRFVNDSEIERKIEHLEQTGLIKQLTTPNTFTITEEGTNYL